MIWLIWTPLVEQGCCPWPRLLGRRPFQEEPLRSHSRFLQRPSRRSDVKSVAVGKDLGLEPLGQGRRHRVAVELGGLDLPGERALLDSRDEESVELQSLEPR